MNTPLPRLAMLSAGFLVVILWLHWTFLAPEHALSDNARTPLATAVALPLGALLAATLGVLVSLFLSNTNRLSTVLRPSRWRILSAIIMAGLTPVAVFDWMPWLAATFIGAGLFPFGVGTSLLDGLIVMVMSIIATILLSALWYLPSSLLISGVHSKPLRIALFALMWWGFYAAILLVNGHMTSPL